MNQEKNTNPESEKDLTDKLEYAPSEDIYNQDERLSLDENGNVLNKGEEDVDKIEQVMTGGDLDVPGSELDDDNELIGEEDEENNYYSLGGDNHEDLEEDNN